MPHSYRICKKTTSLITNMKQLYLSIILAAVMIGQAHARIGFTLDECRKAYGKEVKSEVAKRLYPLGGAIRGWA
jgi:dihydroxyacetone kinase DhaKLM complex PTS-EIIA-like component DhaM